MPPYSPCCSATGVQMYLVYPWRLLVSRPAMLSLQDAERGEIGAHDVGHPADLREAPQLVHRRPPFAPGLAQRLQRHIQPDLVPIFEAVGDGLGRAVDAHGHAVDHM